MNRNPRRDNYLFHGMNALEQTEDIFADYATVRDWEVSIHPLPVPTS
jgi:hypothetical protein